MRPSSLESPASPHVDSSRKRHFKSEKRFHKKTPPRGWVHCRPVGEIIDGTPLIPIRVPLSRRLFHTDHSPGRTRSGTDDVVTLHDVVRQQEERFNRKCTMVVDLTIPEQGFYYEAEDVPTGVKYCKIALPRIGAKNMDRVFDDALKRFVDAVDAHLHDGGGGGGGNSVDSDSGGSGVNGGNNDDDNDHDRSCSSSSTHTGHRDRGFVLVHCTHGLNRTGLMICGYLLHKRIMSSASEAIQMFSKRRSPGIQNPLYIITLLSRYKDMRSRFFEDIVMEVMEGRFSRFPHYERRNSIMSMLREAREALSELSRRDDCADLARWMHHYLKKENEQLEEELSRAKSDYENLLWRVSVLYNTARSELDNRREEVRQARESLRKAELHMWQQHHGSDHSSVRRELGSTPFIARR